LLTHVCFLSNITFYMYLHVTVTSEGFPMWIIFIWPLSSVSLFMPQKVFWITYGFPIFLIFIQLLSIFLIFMFTSGVNSNRHIQD
jgi:hypothetical protein